MRKKDAASIDDPVRAVRGLLIPDGEARSSGDITLMNGRLAAAFAVETDPPWGLPKGGMIDAAVVRDGRPDHDLLSVFDFLPDGWSGWPNTYVRVRILASGPEEASVGVERDWAETRLNTVYSLKRGEDRLHVVTTMTHKGPDATRPIASAYAMWPKKGHTLTPPGISNTGDGRTDGAPADWSAGYDRDWAMALHAPFAERIEHRGRNMAARHALRPGESRVFEGWLQIRPSGDLAAVIDFEIRRKGLAHGRLTGRALDGEGRPIRHPVVMVEKKGKLYGWTVGERGNYALDLPDGEYRIHAAGFRMGATDPKPVAIAGGRHAAVDFTGISNPAKLIFTVTDAASGAPLDARVRIIEGRRSEVGFLGQGTFFTELDRVGRAEASVPPGDYLFEIEHGADFKTLSKRVRISARSGREENIAIALDPVVEPKDRGWYGVDLHHHGDVLDGAAAPEDAVRSQLASGLDVLFLSDHDSTVNNEAMKALAERRGRLFLPAMEISRSWGHFNVYPLMGDPNEERRPLSGTPGEIFKAARAMGVEIIAANHPYGAYGYFRNLELKNVPGGFSPGFDLVEINLQHPVDPVIRTVYDLWNQGRHCFLVAGTDSHDVQTDVSGSIRTYAHLGAEPTIPNLVAALKKGRSYVSFGPLIFPEILFGSCVRATKGKPLPLNFDLVAVNGLSRVGLVENGRVSESFIFEDGPTQARARFAPTPASGRWYALEATDGKGKKAWTNPIWVVPE